MLTVMSIVTTLKHSILIYPFVKAIYLCSLHGSGMILNYIIYQQRVCKEKPCVYNNKKCHIVLLS
jgi:hypothetical protein